MGGFHLLVFENVFRVRKPSLEKCSLPYPFLLPFCDGKYNTLRWSRPSEREFFSVFNSYIAGAIITGNTDLSMRSENRIAARMHRPKGGSGVPTPARFDQGEQMSESEIWAAGRILLFVDSSSFYASCALASRREF